MFSPEPIGKWQLKLLIRRTYEKSENQSRGSHLDQELFIFFKTFDFYFVTLSL